jgi:hypothetical protein
MMETLTQNQIERINQLRLTITQNPAFLNVRSQAEQKARNLLNEKAGRFSDDDLTVFFNLCNTEIVPPNPYSTVFRKNITITRFQLSFIGQNRSLMKSRLTKCNFWIHKIWDSRDDDLSALSEFWRKIEIPGAGIGLPTMLLYLKNPDTYNVWLPFLNDAIISLNGKEIATERKVKNYLQFNDSVNTTLRDSFGLLPQEIDYILYWINARNS